MTEQADLQTTKMPMAVDESNTITCTVNKPSYSEALIENFPALGTPIRPRTVNIKEKAKDNSSKKNNNTNRKKVIDLKIKACKAAPAWTRFEVVGGEEAWKTVKSSIEQKSNAPKVRTIRKDQGIILFAEDKPTEEVLRRTSNFKAIEPRKPRVIIIGIESDTSWDELRWSLVNQNPQLDLNELDVEGIKPLFKTGKRVTHTVNWVA